MNDYLDTLLLLISIFFVIVFYTTVLPMSGLALYPLIGSFIASHGSFISMLVFMYKKYKK